VVGDGDQRRAGARHRHPGPAPARHVLPKPGARADRGEDRREVDEQARGAGGHGPLAGVQQQLVRGHAGERDRGDRGQVAPGGEPDAARRGDRAQDERSDKEPEDGQVSGAEMLERGPDRRERRAPEHYGGGEREGRADGHGSTVSSTGRQHK
jgi:hypothetical protein